MLNFLCNCHQNPKAQSSNSVKSRSRSETCCGEMLGMRKCTVSVYYVIGNKITDLVVFSNSTSFGETPNSGTRISGPNKEIELRPNIEQVAGTLMVTSQGCQDYLDVIFHGHCRPILVTRVCSRTGNENCSPFSFNCI